VLKAKKGAQLICGVKKGVRRTAFLKALATGHFNSVVKTYRIQEGDVFYVPAGTVHAIGKGNLLVEIQVPSQLTYRLYDWGRVDANGKPRPTHLEKALQVLRFKNPTAGKKKPKVLHRISGFLRAQLLKSPDFVIEKWEIKKSAWDLHPERKPLVYCVVKGKGELRYARDLAQKETLSAGETLLIPAALRPLQIVSHPSCTLTFLRAQPA